MTPRTKALRLIANHGQGTKPHVQPTRRRHPQPPPPHSKSSLSSFRKPSPRNSPPPSKHAQHALARTPRFPRPPSRADSASSASPAIRGSAGAPRLEEEGAALQGADGHELRGHVPQRPPRSSSEVKRARMGRGGHPRWLSVACGLLGI